MSVRTLDEQDIQARTKQDLQLIEDALKAARSITGVARAGGLNDLYFQTQNALAALQRISELVMTRQPMLF